MVDRHFRRRDALSVVRVAHVALVASDRVAHKHPGLYLKVGILYLKLDVLDAAARLALATVAAAARHAVLEQLAFAGRNIAGTLAEAVARHIAARVDGLYLKRDLLDAASSLALATVAAAW